MFEFRIIDYNTLCRSCNPLSHLISSGTGIDHGFMELFDPLTLRQAQGSPDSGSKGPEFCIRKSKIQNRKLT